MPICEGWEACSLGECTGGEMVCSGAVVRPRWGTEGSGSAALCRGSLAALADESQTRKAMAES